jgi:hypothetical protein
LRECSRAEVGDAIDAEHHGLAVNDELPMSVLSRASTIHG